MPTIKEIRQLVETLNNDDLIWLCREEFPRVFNSFASGQSRPQQILSLVDFVDRQREIPKLVAAIEEYNLSAYNDFITQHPEYAPKSQPSPETAPEPPPLTIQKCDVLALAANPQGTDPLKLQEEADLILASLRENRSGREYMVQIQQATRAEDVSRYLLQYEPVIVHFAGHGSSTGEILLETSQNQMQPVTPEALANLFATLGQQIECVVLNNCFSLEMADALVKHVRCMIGMSAEIDDRSAVEFSRAFDRGLAFGQGYYQAFELGRTEIQLLQLPDADIPRFIADDLTLLDVQANIQENLPPRTTRSFIDRETSTPTAPLYPLWYGTNRKPIDSNDISKGYSGDRDNLVHYGSCQVAVPKSHIIGSTGANWWQRLKTLTDDRLKLDRSSLNLLDEAGFLASIQKALEEREPNERSALVFIHGFNVSFEDAALRAAQIGFDLQVSEIVAFYSWPSKGKLNGYTADEATIDVSEKYITEFLLNLAQNSDVTKIHIIAHSMGNRGLLRSMQRILHQVQSTSPISFGQIFLAAPDVDPDLFQDLAQAYSQLAERTTLYVSGKDKALAASGIIHDYPRVGYFPPIKVFEGIDTVEVSKIDLTWLGHGYFADARAVLQDMHELLLDNTPPENRFGLRTAQVGTQQYWIIGE